MKYDYDSHLSILLMDVLMDRDWHLTDLARWLGLSPAITAKLLSGPGHVDGETRAALIKSFMQPWDRLSGAEDERLRQATRELMKRVYERSWVGRIKKWLRI